MKTWRLGDQVLDSCPRPSSLWPQRYVIPEEDLGHCTKCNGNITYWWDIANKYWPMCKECDRFVDENLTPID